MEHITIFTNAPGKFPTKLKIVAFSSQKVKAHIDGKYVKEWVIWGYELSDTEFDTEEWGGKGAVTGKNIPIQTNHKSVTEHTIKPYTLDNEKQLRKSLIDEELRKRDNKENIC